MSTFKQSGLMRNPAQYAAQHSFNQLRGLSIYLLFAAVLCSGCATVTTSPQQQFLASGFPQHSANSLKIAILPFANETSEKGAEILVRRMVIEVLLKEAGGKAGFSVLDVETSDGRLAEAGIDTFQAAMDKSLTEYKSLLDADAVLVGQVSEYWNPTGMARLEGMAGGGGASPSVRAYLQLYDCGTGRLLWQGMPQGSVVPLLAIGSLLTSTEKAERIFKEGVARTWPLQDKDTSGN